DGLAAGKGVLVCDYSAQAEAALAGILSQGAFGSAGARVVVEDRLEGSEVSMLALTDGQTIVPLATARDHKRAFDGDQGPNTGGMGAFSPAPMTAELVETTMATIIRPTVATMARRGAPYRGVLYAGLMITAEGPKLIEYNVRFGDPEAQVLMMRLDSDLIELMTATIEGRLDTARPRWSADVALTVVMAAKGYPGPYAKGSPIGGIEKAEALAGVAVFQAGTALKDGGLISAGGRVLDVTARAPTIREARARAYQAVGLIDWPDGVYRTDIGAAARR
ncbi:MAG: phosphoribosylamine--glycine ligase, partial [Bauldia sp.]